MPDIGKPYTAYEVLTEFFGEVMSLVLGNYVQMEQKKLWSEPSLQEGMDVAAEGNRTESLSVLMDVRKELFPKKKKTFEL